MADESESTSTYTLHDACKKMTPDSLALVEGIVKKAAISLRQGGGNVPLLNLGLKAAQTIMAYGYGMPTSKVEHSGTVNHTTVDPAALSTEALKELVAARRPRLASGAQETPTFKVNAIEVAEDDEPSLPPKEFHLEGDEDS